MMPFIIPFLPALISAGGAIAASAIGGKGGSSAGTSGNNAQIDDLLGNLEAKSNNAGKRGKQTFKQFEGAIGPVKDYFTSLLTGDRQSLSELLGPEIGQTKQGYNAVRRTVAEFSPRGGGTTSELAGLQEKESGDITNLLLKGRQTGAAGLESVAGLLGNVSTAESGQALSGISAALGSLLGIRGQDLEKLIADRQFGGGIGGALGQLLGKLLSKIPGGGGSTGSDLGSLTSSGGVGVNFGSSGGLFDFGGLVPPG